MTTVNELFVVMTCGRCDYDIRSILVGIHPDGTFEIKELPTRCDNPKCQADFSGRSDHSLKVTMHQQQRPNVPSLTASIGGRRIVDVSTSTSEPIEPGPDELEWSGHGWIHKGTEPCVWCKAKPGEDHQEGRLDGGTWVIAEEDEIGDDGTYPQPCPAIDEDRY